MQSNRKQKAKDAAENGTEIQKQAKPAAQTARRAAVTRAVRVTEAGVGRTLEELRQWRRSEADDEQHGTATAAADRSAGGATSPSIATAVLQWGYLRRRKANVAVLTERSRGTVEC